MTERNYDYTSRRSTTMVNKIRRYIYDASKRTRKLPGATQREVADHLGMSVTGVGRYLAYMCDQGIIHQAFPETGKWGRQASVYRFGPAPAPKCPLKTIFKDPLMAAFFGRKY